MQDLWGVLAQGYVEVLEDQEKARRVLQVGWDFAWSGQDIENLGRLANWTSKLCGREEAVALLARVEEVARGWGKPTSGVI
jgi:hypothetical protein